MKDTRYLALAVSALACALALTGWWDARRRIAAAAAYSEKAPSSGKGGRLRGATDERFQAVERQLRGFDKTMVEVAYRYSELYFAGKDGNWPYADYQAEKIETALRLGLQRRPKRAASARYFLEEDLPAFNATLKKRDPKAFDSAFGRLRQACNRCHARENVPHFAVQVPQNRLSPVETP